MPPASRGWCSTSRFAGEVRSLVGPIRGKGEFVTGGGLYGCDISAGRAGADGTRLKFSLKTDEQPRTLEAEGLLAFEAATPRFDSTLTLSWPAAPCWQAARPWSSSRGG
jgi:large subunit ribosomal protein L24